MEDLRVWNGVYEMSSRVRKQRSKREILAAALEALSGGPLNRFELRGRARISEPYMESYLVDWVEWGLVEWEGEIGYGTRVVVTEKGLTWLRHWKYINGLMRPG